MNRKLFSYFAMEWVGGSRRGQGKKQVDGETKEGGKTDFRMGLGSGNRVGRIGAGEDAWTGAGHPAAATPAKE